MKKFLIKVLNDLPNLKDKKVLKRFLIVAALVLFSMFAFSKTGRKLASNYDFISDSTRVVLVDHTLKQTMTLSEDILDMDIRLKRTVDLLCEIDGVKYYIINQIKI